MTTCYNCKREVNGIEGHDPDCAVPELIRTVLADEPAATCPVFRPDHNGECLLCDEWRDAHTPEAIALGETLASAVAARTIVEDLLKVIEALMPGVRHLALQDYAILNDAPLRAQAWLGRQK